MKKSDLESGMWVEYRNGDKRLVIKNSEGLFFCGVAGYGDAIYWSDDLINETRRLISVDKIYKSECMMSMYAGIGLTLIWQRSNQMTKEEAEKKFNIKII